jgi:hypothetical protein
MGATVTVLAVLTTSALATTELMESLPGLSPIALEEPAPSNKWLHTFVAPVVAVADQLHFLFYLSQIHCLGW